MIRPITKENPYKICFVCLGNICRSPTAEGIFIHKVKANELEAYFDIDSAGTAAYHVGEPANGISQATANHYGVHLPSKARKFVYTDLELFDMVLSMDAENHRNLNELDKLHLYASKIIKMRDFDPIKGDGNVPDPYFGGQQGFKNVFEILDRSCEHLLDELKKHIQK